MSAIDLRPLDRCFQGVFPSPLATVSADGIPNVIGISHVYRVDHEHVALSEQFMRRTLANLVETGRGELIAVDPATGDQHRLTLRFVRRETEGPTFSRIQATVEGIAQATGMAGIFAVRAGLVCRVVAVKPVEVQGPPAFEQPASRLVGLAHVGRLAERLQAVDEVGALASILLDELAESFGFGHSILMLSDEAGEKLFTVESRGFSASGISSEVRVGEGLLGRCAETRLPVRTGALSREVKYAVAGTSTIAEEISLPLLPEVESLLAIPIASRSRLLGLLVVQSRALAAFSADDEVALSLVAKLAAPQLALARSVQSEEPPPVAPNRGAPQTGAPIAVRYFEENDSVFMNGEYLVKGVAGRILWMVLCDALDRGCTNFTNKELRLDPRLGLSALNDNLEARLLLLRRRLDEAGLPLSLPSTARGRFRLACEGELRLEKIPPGRV